GCDRYASGTNYSRSGIDMGSCGLPAVGDRRRSRERCSRADGGAGKSDGQKMNTTSAPRIDADERGLKHRDLTEKLIGIFFEVYNELGHGFLESVYEQAFAVSLGEKQIFFERQVAVPVWYHGQKIGDFRADLLVDR